jgi:hypothetical protein
MRITDHYAIAHISSGDASTADRRRHLNRPSAAAYVKRGDPVPDVIVMNMLYKRVKEQARKVDTSSTAFPHRRTGGTASVVVKGLAVAV